MPQQSNEKSERKKTFRFSNSDQAAMDALRKHYSLRTEAAAIEYILHKFMKLDQERRMQSMEIFELKAEIGLRKSLAVRFASVMQEVLDRAEVDRLAQRPPVKPNTSTPSFGRHLGMPLDEEE